MSNGRMQTGQSDKKATALLLGREQSSKKLLEKIFLPFRADHLSPRERGDPRNHNEKPYRSFEKIRDGLSPKAGKWMALPSEASTTSTTGQKDSELQRQPSKCKLLSLKQTFLEASAEMVGSAHYVRKESKLGTFKKHKSTINDVIVKQIQSIVLPKPAPPLLIKSKPQPRSREYKWLVLGGRSECFQLLKFMDEGSFGQVFLVRHTRTLALFCLKVVEKSQLTETSERQLRREIFLQSRLDHPGIVHLYAWSSDAKCVYLLMQPCMGGNLFNKLRSGALQEKEVRKYVKELCVAMDYLHSNDIIHRDIKPENILLHDNSVKICDFGWAVCSPLLRSTQCGTPLYTPPQIVKNQSYDSKIDVWCIGVLTYELLYAKIPFEIRHPNDLAKIVEEEVKFPADIPVSDSAKDFIWKCLAKVPKNRLTIAQTLDHEFLVVRPENFRQTFL